MKNIKIALMTVLIAATFTSVDAQQNTTQHPNFHRMRVLHHRWNRNRHVSVVHKR